MFGDFLSSSIRNLSSLWDAIPESKDQKTNKINLPKVTDSLEQITKINQQLTDKYNRHPVITDMNFLIDPTIDPMSFFTKVVDENNNGLVFEVTHERTRYVLQCKPKFHSETEQQYLEEQFKVRINEIDVSYELEDSGFQNIIKIHHVFIKKTYDSYHKNFFYCVWVLKEDFMPTYEPILNFDYEANPPNDYYDDLKFGKHLPNKLISIKAAKQFCKEYLVTYVKILEIGYLPCNYNYIGIAINYKNDFISWKFVDYAFFQRMVPTARYISRALTELSTTLTYHLCKYTNHSVKENDSTNHHPFWSALEQQIKNKGEKYNKLPADYSVSFEEFISMINEFINVVEQHKN